MASSKVVFITGANYGIGYETAKAFYQDPKPYHVLVGARSPKKGEAAIQRLQQECPEAKNTLELVLVDLESDESIEKAYEHIQASPGRLDWLINNAGVSHDPDWTRGKMSLRDCFTKAYDVNVTGTHIVTCTLMPLLLKSSDPRLIFVAGLSQVTQAAEKYFPTPAQPAGWPKKVDFETIGYRCSKTALTMLMLDWNHKLQADGVKVWSVGPGFLRTGLGNMEDSPIAKLAGHPSIGANVIKSVAEGERDVDVGKIVGKDGLIPI
ncbi:cytochrome P450 [Apiospora arundinis]